MVDGKALNLKRRRLGHNAYHFSARWNPVHEAQVYSWENHKRYKASNSARFVDTIPTIEILRVTSSDDGLLTWMELAGGIKT